MLLHIKLYNDDKLIIDEKNVEYQKEKERITFQLENMNHQIDLKNKIFERYNEEFYFNINFEKETCNYELKTHQIKLDIIVDDSFYEQRENSIEMTYVIETEDQKNKILIEFLK